MKLYIWWTTSDDCINVGDGCLFKVAKAPEYLHSEYRSRLGRAGRGRLWVAPQFAVEEIAWNEGKASLLRLEERAGIVIAESELALCLQLPGVVTDLELNHIPGVYDVDGEEQ